MATLPTVGQRLSYDGTLCTVRYVGEVAGTAGGGIWLGVEWDDPARGKHDGVHKGVRYFACSRRPPPPADEEGKEGLAGSSASWTPASFVRPTRRTDPPRTFLEAVRAKYASEAAATAVASGASATGRETTAAAAAAAAPTRQIVISGKVAEEVGFDKVRRQLAQIETLRVVILDGMCVAAASADELDRSSANAIRATCPRIAELDLSRNLFTDFRAVADICRELPSLRSLRVNGNRFQIGSDGLQGAFDGVRELAAEETLLSWVDLGRLVAPFPALVTLAAGANGLAALWPPWPPALQLPCTATLTTLSLEFNELAALSDLASLAALPALRNLHLKGNRIAHVAASASASSASSASPPPPLPVFSPNLHYVDLAYNRVASWAFVDALPDVFPGLRSLRLSHNPIYDDPNLDDTAVGAGAGAGTTTTGTAAGAAAVSTEESYMVTVGRLAALRTLNFSAVTAADRTNAELFYLSRIAKQLAAVPGGGAAEAAVLVRHRRYDELCALYGAPAVVRHTATNPAFLDARLVQVHFVREGTGEGTGERIADGGDPHVSVAIPKSFDMYAVKGIAARLFGAAAPQRVRLVWETGEWDPVAGVDEEEEDEELGDEEEEDDDDEEDGEGGDNNEERNERVVGAKAAQGDAKQAQTVGDDEAQAAAAADNPSGDHPQPDQQPAGRWVKREVELKESPRQFGFCVDGMEARIRVVVQ
ncbi:tubulin-specific chaperone [Niveomyces insectorum RCEF 264]|uniref:Tubulin-specific chaperone n=1 Tax=Niveomyces insectorum RCEF 264 TaxID=1081102 RepID=A0A167PDQ4_9HYPO|nr:tubulin-specific chaperone [Niveomyces insectorum RCEF 264]